MKLGLLEVDGSVRVCVCVCVCRCVREMILHHQPLDFRCQNIITAHRKGTHLWAIKRGREEGITKEIVAGTQCMQGSDSRPVARDGVLSIVRYTPNGRCRRLLRCVTLGRRTRRGSQAMMIGQPASAICEGLGILETTPLSNT